MAQPLSDDQAPLDQVVTTGLIVGWEWVASSSAEAQGNASTRPADSPAQAAAAQPAAAAAAAVPAPAEQPSAGSPVAARHPDQRYQVRRLLGKGGMGEIQLRKDLTIGREVAMKRMLPAHATNPVARARFIREAQVQGQLEHPSIVPVYDLAVEADGSVFFTMKRLRGRTLEDILRVLKQGSSAERSQFPLHRLLQNFSSVCLAVEFAHSRGVIHRDLKPANIMLGDFGEVYVLDWGLAKIQGSAGGAPVPAAAAQRFVARSYEAEAPAGGDDVTATLTPVNSAQPAVTAMADSVNTAVGQVVGTLAYMSPEQSEPETETLDARSDVYTLGVILFEILTLERLRPRGNPDIIFAAIREGCHERPSIRAPHRDVPPELDEIFLRAVQQSPDKRYQSARALHQAIEAYLSGERDTALRREMAAQHTSLAASAVEQALSGGPDSEEARRTALTEVGKAMALDPANDQALGLLRRILSEPPRKVPAEVEAMVKSDLATRERLRLRTLALSGSAALVLIPLLLMMGVHDWPLMAMLVLFSILNIGLRLWVSYPTTPIAWRYVSQLASLSLMFCFGRIMGPLLFMTVPLTVHTLVHAISAQAALRRFVLLTSCGLLFGMVTLERFGVLARSYHFSGDTLVITPNLVGLPPVLTIALLLSISVLYILLPALALSRLPEHLAEAERRLAVHAWQLRQLIPEPSSRRSIH